MLILSLFFLLPNLLNADAIPNATSPCELVHEGYKPYGCSQLSENEWWSADVQETSLEACLAKCEETEDCTHAAFHEDLSGAGASTWCDLQQCSGSTGSAWGQPEAYFYHEYSCYSSYQCRPVVMDNAAEPEVISFPADVTTGCHGLDQSDEFSCSMYDQDHCVFFGAEKCFWVQDSCTMANLGAEAIENCDEVPAGSIAVFFICFFAAGCIAAVLVCNCPEFCDTVKSNVMTAVQKILSTLYSVFSASWGLYEGINVSVALGCLKDSVDLGSTCSDTLGLMESGTIIIVLFSSLSMLLILVFACGMMWFGLKVTDDMKLGLYFVHFFELGVLIGCAIGLSANPDDCYPSFGPTLDDQKNAFIKVVVFTVLFMVFDCLSFLGVTDYISNSLGCSSEEEKQTDQEETETKKESECSDDVIFVSVKPLQLAPSRAEPIGVSPKDGNTM